MRSTNFFFYFSAVLVGFVASRPTETNSLAARDCSIEIAAMNIARREKRGLSKRTFYPHMLNNICVLAPEVPLDNYVPQTSLKQNLVEGQIGVSLILDIGVLDVTTCQPLPNVVVELWSANSQGNYGDTFLRGAFPTASNGIAEFETIFPGYTSGGANHFNILVHHGSDLGNPVAHGGQLFFTDPWTDIIGRSTFDNYYTNTHSRILNAKDPNYVQANSQGFDATVDIEEIHDDWPEVEHLSQLDILITVGVNPTIGLQREHCLFFRRRASTLAPHVNSAVISPGSGTYPRTTTLSDGSVLAVFTAFSGASQILTVTKSTDGGATFVAWGTVATQTNDLDNPYIIQLPNGNLVATFRNNDRTSPTVYTYYRITAAGSTDGGKTWTFLSHVDQRAAASFHNGLWEPFMRISKADSSLQIYYASENADNDQDILLRSSHDGGLSWSGSTTVAGATTVGRDGMPGCANFNEGGVEKLMCVFETNEGRSTFTIKSVVSTNEGASWGSLRSQVYVPTGNNNNAGAPQIVAKPDGTLVASFMTDEDTSHQWVNGANFKIVTSPPVSTGQWGNKVTVSGVQSSWPGLMAKSDGSVLACADNGGNKCHSITFT